MNHIPDWLKLEVEDYFRVEMNLSPKIVLDIGANIGAFALRAHQAWPDARIMCYEPIPSNVAMLRQHVDPQWAEVFPYAVRSQGGVQEIFVGDMFVTSGFSRGIRQTATTIPVQCVSARDLHDADIVKIDTEGSEIEILRCMKLESVEAILLEHHSKRDAAEIKSILKHQFETIHDESERDVGTMIFKRK